MVCGNVLKLGESGGMLAQEKFESEIASGTTYTSRKFFL